jgi:hypothetical protein
MQKLTTCASMSMLVNYTDTFAKNNKLKLANNFNLNS